MHIAVIGAGLVGLTTAHALHKRNLQVTVFEAESAPGAVTSFANGAQLSYSYTDPMASPELLRSLPSILAGRAAGINIRHKADLDYLQWSAQFLWNCLPHRQRKNAAFLEQLAARSAQLMDEYHQNPALSYYHSSKGKLVLLDKKPGKRVVEGVHRKQQSGTDISILRRNQVLELVPQLNQWTSTFSYALFSNGDDVADPHEFSRSLSDYLAGSGVEFCFEQNVESLQSCSRGIDVHIDDRVDHLTPQSFARAIGQRRC